MQVFTRLVDDPNAVQLTKADQDCFAPFWLRAVATLFSIIPAAASGPFQLRAAQRRSGSGGLVRRPSIPTARLCICPVRKGVGGEPVPDGGEAKEFWDGPARDGLTFSPDGSKLLARR